MSIEIIDFININDIASRMPFGTLWKPDTAPFRSAVSTEDEDSCTPPDVQHIAVSFAGKLLGNYGVAKNCIQETIETEF